MAFPVNVGDKIHDGHWYEPATVVSAMYIGPPTEDDYYQAEWMGYMLRPSAAHCCIKYQLPNGGYGWKRFHLELHDGMLLPADLTPSDPDDWNNCRCRIVERAGNYQPDLFAHAEYRQLDLFEGWHDTA
jgi:hypothetical protein